MSASKPAVVDRADLEAAALETARVLGRAIGESLVFRISQEIGIDYGATCAPASGCCCC